MNHLSSSPLSLAVIRPLRQAGSIALAVASVLTLGHSAQAVSDVWNSTTSGNFNDPTKWLGGNVPGATSGTTSPDTATFGNVVLTAATTVTVDAGRNVFGLTFDGTNTSANAYILSGGSLLLTAGGLIQTTGAGGNYASNVNSTLTLAGDATFTAGSTNNARTLAIGTTVTGSATTGTSVLTLNGANTAALNVSGAGGNAITGIVANGAGGGTVSVVKSGAGTWALNANSTYSGGTTVNQGILISGQANALGVAGANVTVAGSTLSLRGNASNNSALENIAYNKNITITSNSTLDVARLGLGGQKTIQNAGALNIGAQTLTITNNQGFAYQNVGATTVSGNATFQNNMNGFGSGGGAVANPNGFNLSTLTVADSVATGTATNVTFGVVATGLSGGLNNTGNTFITGAITNNATDATKTLAITKIGAGDLTLSGASTYTGATTVNAGRLLVNGSLTSAITATTGTLAGTGSTTGTVTIGDGTGTGDAILSPGVFTGAPATTGTVGTFTTSSSLGMLADSAYAFTLNSTAGTADQIAANGVTLATGSTFTFNDVGNGSGVALNQAFTIINNTAPAGAIAGTFSNLAEGSTIVSNGVTYQASYTGSTGNDLVLTATAIPEPATWATLLGSLGLMLGLTRFRRRAV